MQPLIHLPKQGGHQFDLAHSDTSFAHRVPVHLTGVDELVQHAMGAAVGRDCLAARPIAISAQGREACCSPRSESRALDVLARSGDDGGSRAR